MAWWTTLTGSFRSVVILQVDLAGHSKWLLQSKTEREFADARADFADTD
jgi:hypothetical protein